MKVNLLDKNHIKPVLNAIREAEAIRFSSLKKITGLEDSQIDRAIKTLKEEGLVWPRTIPTKGTRTYSEYVLSPTGKQLANALETMARSVKRQKLDKNLESTLVEWLQSKREIHA